MGSEIASEKEVARCGEKVKALGANVKGAQSSSIESPQTPPLLFSSSSPRLLQTYRHKTRFRRDDCPTGGENAKLFFFLLDPDIYNYTSGRPKLEASRRRNLNRIVRVVLLFLSSQETPHSLPQSDLLQK